MPHSLIKNVKERKEPAFFYKESKRTQERCVLLKRTYAQPWKNPACRIDKPKPNFNLILSFVTFNQKMKSRTLIYFTRLKLHVVKAKVIAEL